MKNSEDDDLIQRLKEIFDSALPPISLGEGEYPKDALPLGTYVRTIRHDKLGIITDAFYRELDKGKQKIIFYTILLFPTVDPLTRAPKHNDQYYITNECEYEVIAYLMISPANLSKITASFSGEFFK